MSGTAGDDLLAQIDTLPRTAWSGEVYRYTTVRRDPLSGAGARLNGGRWNPPEIFAALYLATPVAACMAELDRAAQSQGFPAEALLRAPYKLHTLTATQVSILDLTDPQTLEAVGLTPDDISSDEWEACQAVGHGAWFLHFDGVLAESASGIGQVLTLFESRLGGGQLVVQGSEDLTVGRYRDLRM
ncbi:MULTISPECIES: RES family NAD+ phosphorylase [unclassified Rathayibacter]|uniref:RES family NAD+ phosphorylase n=1 Tax=unclassified Rathayibacter TaxID=2609250 RepID=UPI00188D8ECF|nr:MULTISPECIES: RES domain-containing protein [unclassified Rathayibacter]MBF4461229.1 RES domain-containing protein [Rathayibacter sp. VKM Ac-2879]MBF4502640.1 RES domain-containing protein [Rathayibacter sp. VKM Ac-2878]